MGSDDEKQDVDGAGKGGAGDGAGGDKDGKTHPETVSWTQYVGVKEKLTKAETELKGQVQTLEEKLAGSVSTDDFKTAWEKLDETQKELAALKGKGLTEKRDFLKGKGISEDDVANMSDEALSAAIRVLEQHKPKPDLGGGGGSGELKGSPMELARQAYEQSPKK